MVSPRIAVTRALFTCFVLATLTGAPSGCANDHAGANGDAGANAEGGDADATGDATDANDSDEAAPARAIQTVFVIVMENHDWSQIVDNASAPYINSLLATAAYAEAYYNPPHVHPSLPNYLWIEAGTDFGIRDDAVPSRNHQSTTEHLVTQLTAAGISWRTYQEGITGTECPLRVDGLYAPKHNPMIYFDDITDGNDPESPTCLAHVRPWAELARDLESGDVARYNFLTPDQCHDMHNSSGCATDDPVRNGDDWLSRELPVILQSNAYLDGGVVFLTWDESEHGDGPIGFIVLSPLAKGGGYHNAIPYTHGSLLRTLEEVFEVPLLRDAEVQTDLSDLFATFP